MRAFGHPAFGSPPRDYADRADIVEHILAARHELPSLILDASLQVLYCNEKAARLFCMPETSHLRHDQPRLSGLQSFPTLKNASALCRRGMPVDIMIQLPTLDRALVNARIGSLLLGAEYPHHGPGSPAYLLLMGLPVPESTALARRTAGLFELSPAEERVLGHLLKGDTATRIATETDTGLSTVRTHIQSILAKTGVKRQVDLIRTLCGLRC